MIHKLPDRATITSAAALALRAPSVHNSQPWRWRVSTDSIHLYADPQLHLVHTDPDARDLYLSCGITLHHMRVALASLGWKATVRHFPNAEDRYHIAALQTLPQLPDENDIALAAAIPRRRSDRRWYSSWSVPEGYLAILERRSAVEGVVLDRAQMSSYFRRAAALAADQHAHDRAYQAELAIWTGGERVHGGIPSENTPAQTNPPSPSARVFSSPSLPQPARAEAEEDAGALLIVGTPGDDRTSQVRAGEAASAVLLEATAMGLSSCAFSEPLEVPETREIIKYHVSTNNCYPQLIIRVGWAPANADPLPATPRRELSTVLVGLDAAQPAH